MAGREEKYKFFIAGIIQGSIKGESIHDQSNRDRIKDIILANFNDKETEGFCPFENHKNSITYDDKRAKEVFFMHIDKVRESDVLIVYLPEASLGTGIEMWEAYHHNKIIITISQMTTNWVIRILSDAVFKDIESFEEYVKSGKIKKMLGTKHSKGN